MNNYIIRPLSLNDYYKGYFNLLSQLTIAPKIDYYDYQKFIRNIEENNKFNNEHNNKHLIFVIEDNMRIIATGTLLIEKKLIRNGKCVGHIEDIIVDKEYRQKGIGLIMLKYLKNISLENNCYKVILDCEEKLENFYKKCGFNKNGYYLAHYFK